MNNFHFALVKGHILVKKGPFWNKNQQKWCLFSQKGIFLNSKRHLFSPKNSTFFNPKCPFFSIFLKVPFWISKKYHFVNLWDYFSAKSWIFSSIFPPEKRAHFKIQKGRYLFVFSIKVLPSEPPNQVLKSWRDSLKKCT